MSENNPVTFQRLGTCGLITLRNERALNALTLEMIELIHPQLVAWRDDSEIACVVIEGAGERAFCAGGDVRAVAQAGRAQDRSLTRQFFWHEYRLNRLIGTLGKPYVALMDGITMGGGVGLSAHGSFQVATERTLWAMPETAIGFFPDVGASHVLNRLDPAMAAHLALTGRRLGADDLLHLGLATHFVPSDSLEALKTALVEAEVPVRETLDRFGTSAPVTTLMADLSIIKATFGAPSVEAILETLIRDGGDRAKAFAETLSKMSPTSCKVTLEQLKRTRNLDLDACLKLEFRMSQHFMAGHDFYEGIRAVLIDKDQSPSWRPDTLEGVSETDVDLYFGGLSEGDLHFD
ncbi:enoyl-CoA hydratase/isomerase family protein, partial [Coleofasciculus chthonoplastes]|uniref:enoyl-CoA hydratase/isomerase family protein n=1 Tax=Coleofasciculus chthonoplastes TaxID=64178 RepID=UPI0032F41CD5